MTTDDKAYGLDILKKVISTYLDETVPVTEEGLNSLVSKRDEIVWKIATEIYRQSEHKVEFSVVRDVVNSRIEFLTMHIATEKAVAHEHANFARSRRGELAGRSRISSGDISYSTLRRDYQ